MAEIFADDFETGDLSLWTTASGAAEAYNYYPLSGSYSLYFGDTGYVEKTFTGVASVYGTFLYEPDSLSDAEYLCSFYNGSTVLGGIRRNTSSGKLEAYQGTSLVATGTAELFGGESFEITFYYLPHDSAGTFNVSVNSVSDIAYTGQTSPSTSNIDKFRIGDGGGI